MDDRSTARRANLELVKKDVKTDVMSRKEDERPNSGVVPSPKDGLGIASGVVLEGKYLVGRIVGSGAVGIVFEAKNVELDEKVAIKCLRPEMLIDSGMVARFAREAKAAAAIKSEYVATVHDVGTTDDGVPYMVMEYLEGKDLGNVVADSGTLAPRTAAEYALQCCEALAVAHSKGIVHRDIKPENLLLTERAGGMRIVKVLDFGISKTALTGSIFQSELPLVKTVNLMGTPLYMSPEQVRVSDSVDVRSDIWSLGMVIYEILTGQTAFNGASITEICAAILESPPNPIELYRNDLPSGLVDVITKCLQKDVTKRYQNIAELALALMPFGPKRSRLNVERAVAVLQGSGQIDPAFHFDSEMPPASPSDVSLVPIPKAPSVPGFDGTPSLASGAPAVAVTASAPAPPAPRPRGFLLGGIAVVLLAIVGTALLVRGRDSSAAPVATTVAPPTTETVAPPPTVTPPTPAALPGASTPATVASSQPSAKPPPSWAVAPRPPARGAMPPAHGAPKAASSASGKARSTDEADLGY